MSNVIFLRTNGRRPAVRSRRRARLSRFASRMAALVLAIGIAAGCLWFDGRTIQPPDAIVTGALHTHFAFCATPPHADCVIDGDTFYLGSQPIRIADIDTPETFRPDCAAEAERGKRATMRMHELLNAGPIELRLQARDKDRYGRSLRTVHRGGRSLGQQLVSEGLARPWGGARRSWCA
ncbi:thermonuclease family protein [Pararhizobium haloflavum]|uniref:thermonuclease family protein n=1 Tax=Pararhizobium haloflavum TaxID=2037914 RepID=UPI001FDEB7FE|nr:thermonuclease family protein [Pararhizobium haloflavum]